MFNYIQEELKMDSPTETTAKHGSSNKLIIGIAAVAVAASVGVAAYTVVSHSKGNDGDGSNRVGYATEAKVMLDEDSLQAAIDEAMANARNMNVALDYKNNAYSDNGKDFECYILNSASNAYDMYLGIYSDPKMTDQLFLSGLVPPGSGFENITLDKELPVGDHRVYVMLTQVKDDENGDQIIHNQVSHTMDFHVSE